MKKNSTENKKYKSRRITSKNGSVWITVNFLPSETTIFGGNNKKQPFKMSENCFMISSEWKNIYSRKSTVFQ